MTELKQRVFRLNVHGRVLSDLDVTFRVERSLSNKQNAAEVRIFNLAPDTRKYLQSQPQGCVVELKAGYQDMLPDLPRLLLAQLRLVTSTRDGQDWVTEISSGDSDQFRRQAISFSLGAGASFKEAVRRTVDELKAGAGNLTGALGKIPDRQLPDGVVVHGFGDKALEGLLRSADLEHSWQDGAIQVIPRGGALAATAVVLSEDTGMIGSPELGMGTGKAKAVVQVKVRSLLNPQIYPGRVVHIKAENLDGLFVADKVVHDGDSTGQNWYTDSVCRPRSVQ